MEYKLRPFENIRFESSKGKIIDFKLRASDLVLRFYSNVRGLTTGSGKHRRSLMPTYLEHLRANRSSEVFWVTICYIIGLIAALWRWWMNP